MTRQNRVNPFGEIVANTERGTLMGNRGILHDDNGQVVRNSRGKTWISCRIDAPGPKRPLMEPGSYTVLFFLDEPTALAAGHRPCAQCRREAYKALAQAWVAAQLSPQQPSAREIDTVLAAERGRPSACANPDALPDGVMVSVGSDGACWTRDAGTWRRWSFAGLGTAEPLPAGDVVVLTPPSLVAVLKAGYRADGR